MKQFVHLHLHSGFSLLDGAIDHDVLAATAAKHGMPAVAVTDHGNLFGAIGFHNAATKAGVKLRTEERRRHHIGVPPFYRCTVTRQKELTVR